MPYPGSTWRPHHAPVRVPHEYVRRGTSKVLTLFEPATGQVRLRPATRSTNTVLHGWLRESLGAIIAALPAGAAPINPAANRVAWQAWQKGLSERFTLPQHLPPLRMLLVWDNLAGHKTPEMVGWLCQHGIMPLYTPLGGSWLNMAEAIQRIFKRRALGGQHPQTTAEIGTWFEQTAQAWNKAPTPFVWNGKRRQRRRRANGVHRAGGSAAHTRHPIPRKNASARNGRSRAN